MQTMLRLDTIRFVCLDTTLRTVGFAGTTLDAVVGDAEALLFRLCMAHREVGTVDGAHAKVEVFYLGIADDKDDANGAGVTGIDVHQVGLFLEDDVLPVFLFFVWHRLGNSREANHLFELCQGVNLHVYVIDQLLTEVLSASSIEIYGIRLVVNSTDAAHLRMAVLVNGGKCQNADIAEFLDTGFCVHNAQSL